MPFDWPEPPNWQEDPVGELIGADVLQQFTNMRDYATASRDLAVTHLAELQMTNPDIPTITVQSPPDVQDPDDTMTGIMRPDKPNTTMTTYADPSRPDLADVIMDTISGIPAFDVATVSITLPAQPAFPDEVDPGTPDELAAIDYPNKPVYTLPTLPTLHEAAIPAPPSLTMPVFEGTMPVDDLVAPTNTFQFSETMYNSELLTHTTTKLNTDVVNGGTGLGADIENAIWNRQAERDALVLEEAKDRVASEWAERGFGLPDGVLTAQLQELEKQYNDTRLTAGRDIAIKQAELAQANTHFAIEKAISVESNLMQFTSQMAQRQLEAAKALIDASVSIFNAQVAKYNAQIEGYKAQAVVYEAQIRGALAQVEIFRAQIEAAKLTIDLDNAYVQLYNAQLNGVEQLINLYRAEMEGAKIKTDVERLRLEAFKTKVDAYVAKVNIHVAMFNCYSAAIQGENAKAEMYAHQVSAYKTRVEASQIEANIAIEKARLESEIQKNSIAIYNSDVEAYKAKIEAEKTRIEAIIDAYKGEIEAYKADATVAATEVDARVKVYEGKIKEAALLAESYNKQAEISLKAFSDTMAIRTEIAKATAQISSQLAASSMAGVNVSAAMSESDSKRKDYSTNNSSQLSYHAQDSWSNNTNANSNHAVGWNYHWNYNADSWPG